MNEKKGNKIADDELILIKGLRNGDEKAFGELFHRYYSRLCSFTYQYTNSTDSTEDIVQDIFLSIWQRRNSITIEGSFKSYLYKSARNSALNYLRHKKIKRNWAEKKKDSANFGQSYVKSPEKKIQDQERFEEIEQAIEQALDELPERRKLIFSLSRDDGLTYEEIAEVLDISVKTVETQIRRSKKTIHELLAKYLPVFIFFAS